MLHITHEEGFELWTIDSPARGNGIGTTLAALFNAATVNLIADHSCNLPLVITAKPIERPKGTIWVAGGDLIELAAVADQYGGRQYAQTMSEALRNLRKCGRLVITAVDGAAIGGGAELAVAGDIRLATQRSSFEFKQLKAGLATGYGSARRLVELIGLARAERLLYFCEKIEASEAENLGLIHRLADGPTELAALVRTTCEQLRALPIKALTGQKKMFAAACAAGSDTAREAELDLFTEIWGNEQHAAFLKQFSGNK